MSKINPLMGVNARFGKEAKQAAKTAAKGVKTIKLPTTPQETRAAFPELPSPDAKTLEIIRAAKNPANVTGSKLSVLA